MSEKPKELKPKGAGGFRPGAGRKYKGVQAKKIRIAKYTGNKLKNHVDWLHEISGKYISQQDYSSKAILKYALSSSKDSSLLQEVAEEIAPSFAPWTTLTISEEAHNELTKLVKKIKTFTTVNTKLSSVFTVIILEEIKEHKGLLSSLKSKPESSL
ncbi:MAG: hypothetical protein V7K47_06765 [Nostoc sp.]